MEVLWTLEDCKHDPNIRMTPSNASRPRMEYAIRHEDGTMISSGEWLVIKATARSVKADLLSLGPPTSTRAKDQPKTKIYFRTHFLTQWNAALEKMETQQPLLALCAAHWKADHVLGNTLLVKASQTSDSSDTSGNSPSTNDSRSRKRSKGKRRSANQRSRDSKKQKQHDERVDIGLSDKDPSTFLHTNL